VTGAGRTGEDAALRFRGLTIDLVGHEVQSNGASVMLSSLGDPAADPRLIATVRGAGYKFVGSPE
jgi:DNA-binding response OmpR family regulator